MTKVSQQTIVMGIPAQGAITRDNVTLTVDAVVYFRVVDSVKAVINIEDYLHAVLQVAQTSLRSVIGRADLDTLLSDRDQINAELRAVIDAPTEGPWGLHIERVEVRDVALPDGMKRSMSRQAEAERERRARVIAADGEFQASTKLAQAARVMADTPSAMQLRLLQTVADVSAEKNSTLVMPFPVELLRFFEKATDTGGVVADQRPRHCGQVPRRRPASGRDTCRPTARTVTHPADTHNGRRGAPRRPGIRHRPPVTDRCSGKKADPQMRVTGEGTAQVSRPAPAATASATASRRDEHAVQRREAETRAGRLLTVLEAGRWPGRELRALVDYLYSEALCQLVDEQCPPFLPGRNAPEVARLRHDHLEQRLAINMLGQAAADGTVLTPKQIATTTRGLLTQFRAHAAVDETVPPLADHAASDTTSVGRQRHEW